MNLFEKSGQSVGDNSSAIQVTGDAHFGNTTTEVMAICQLMVKSEMASLRADAYALVDSRAQEFGQQIAEKLSKDVDEKLRAKLADPDIQYTLNQAVIQVARKGFDAKSELLKELIVSKFKSTEEEENLILDHALDTTQKLTTSEIKLLSLIYYFRFCHKTMGEVDITEIVKRGTDGPSVPGLPLQTCFDIIAQAYKIYELDYIKILSTLDSLKPVNKQMLAIKGCINSEQHYEKNYMELIKERTGIVIDNEEFFKAEFATLSSIMESFSIKKIEEFNDYVLSPLGIVIAENYLEAHNFFSR
ncbi:LPO_1073/Vpar_1526 family protein [Pantoea eucalypti]|uniref:LPO_1073/Vpar_1526 family protein n=1 Tax=Pantoea eucalypti TaxID=470933 RepID=UPI003EE4A189